MAQPAGGFAHPAGTRIIATMTDRGLPIVDGAPACPFVAFDDDRDERASAPDTRHRCYAEVRPAPRAQAHQDAYCLSSAFALCPTFQDWARREGARVREQPTAESLVTEEPPRRNPQRGWAAPPPWLGGPTGAASGEVVYGPPDFVSGSRGIEGGLAGSLAHQIARPTSMRRAPAPRRSGRAPAVQVPALRTVPSPRTGRAANPRTGHATSHRSSTTTMTTTTIPRTARWSGIGRAPSPAIGPPSSRVRRSEWPGSSRAVAVRRWGTRDRAAGPASR